MSRSSRLFKVLIFVLQADHNVTQTVESLLAPIRACVAEISEVRNLLTKLINSWLSQERSVGNWRLFLVRLT
jgi:hypothetical protein